MTRPRLILFTDLDGTLLDHKTYEWRPAEPALEKLANAGIPVILNSSKTRAEIASLRQCLGNQAPYIVENGAAVVIPDHWFDPVPEHVVSFGANHAEIRQVLAELRSQGFRFQGFADLSAESLAGETGLTLDDAARAKQRSGTEPLIWQGSDGDLERFRDALAQRDLRLLAGGRFLHVMGQFDKADGVAFLLQEYQRANPNDVLVSVALGDGPNDQAMLAAVDVPVIINGVRSNELTLPSDRHVMRSINPGPAGWNECVLNILIEYGY